MLPAVLALLATVIALRGLWVASRRAEAARRHCPPPRSAAGPGTTVLADASDGLGRAVDRQIGR
jgi:hypothetical protein